MLGFRPFSTNPISDIQLPAITGTISATDDNDTASLLGTVGYATDFGVISTTDSNDTASITGSVGAAPATGTISATDGNDTASIEGFVGVPVTNDTHDGFTRKEIERARKLQAKIAKLEKQRLDAYRKTQADRKSAIKELVDPTPKSKQKKNKVQSNQEVSEDIPSEITVLDNTIANLVKQQQELLHGVMLRQELVRIQTVMAIFEAKRLAELDDEEALLLLL